jgi:hypothetical protein
MWCSAYDEENRRHYTRACGPVFQTNSFDDDSLSKKVRSWTSIDLEGFEYDGKCPYYDSCSLTLDNGLCKFSDYVFSFEGYVGRVVNVDTSQQPNIVSVTFNDGRTSYNFLITMLKLEPKSMYGTYYGDSHLSTYNYF